MSKIMVKKGTVKKKMKVLEGMYVTTTSRAPFKVEIAQPIDTIIAIWKGAKDDQEVIVENLERDKKALAWRLEKIAKDCHTNDKKRLINLLRKNHEEMGPKCEEEYKEGVQFIQDFEKTIKTNYECYKNYDKFFKEQIEKLERSIK